MAKKKTLKIGRVSLGLRPRIALVISDIKNSGLMKKAESSGADILELRLDQCKKIPQKDIVKTVKTIKTKGMPLIATIRSEKEGGGKSFSQAQRLKLFEAVIPLVDAVDIELSSKTIIDKVIKKAKQAEKKVIISYHNFKSTPSESSLKNIIFKAEGKGADIVKIAALAKNQSDIIKLLELTITFQDKNLITIAMGEKGTVSRVLFPLAGSVLTYTYLDKPSAGGQIPLYRLKEQLDLFYSGR